jgi:glyoxylase-like metal-dependent hydrolase (beta-lactamase superfamily II)
MIIKTFTSSPFETNSYLVYDENSKEAIVIDSPPESSKKVLDQVRALNLTVNYIINTHGHIDHVEDNEILKNELKAKLFIHRKDEFWLNPAFEIRSFLPFDQTPSKADGYLNDGDILTVGNLKFIVIFTPGHTSGGICLYESLNKVLFSGDTLFKETVGRTDLLGGSMETLIDSIKNKICILPDETVVYPGHNEITTIEHEKEFNPYLHN